MVEVDDIEQEDEGQAEKGVNNKLDLVGCSNNGVEVEVVDII